MSKIGTILTATAIVAVLAFQQAEIQTVHDEVEEVRAMVVKTSERLRYSTADVDCLARNIYHEAGVEPTVGKYAVAQVTLNRLKTGRWGHDICSVVYSKAQFSWTLNKKKLNEHPRGALWDESRKVARTVLDQGARVPSLAQSTYYHADYVQPLWVKSVVKIQQIGQHIFYKTT